MAREKVQIKKIGSATARQVTFSKRRKGIFKKAEELAVLCDADVALIIFSATGKLFEFSSSSMKGLLEKHILHPKNLRKLEQPSLELQLIENSNYSSLSKEVGETSHKLRQMRGEELQELSIEQLQELEKCLEAGLSRVMEMKGNIIAKEIDELQRKEAKLVEENERLRKQVTEKGDNQVSVEATPANVVGCRHMAGKMGKCGIVKFFFCNLLEQGSFGIDEHGSQAHHLNLLKNKICPHHYSQLHPHYLNFLLQFVNQIPYF